LTRGTLYLISLVLSLALVSAWAATALWLLIEQRSGEALVAGLMACWFLYALLDARVRYGGRQ
jgi:hypothetical protein